MQLSDLALLSTLLLPPIFSYPNPGKISRGEPWPLPQKIEYSGFELHVGRIIIDVDKTCDILVSAKNVYEKRWLLPNRADIARAYNFSNDAPQRTLKVTVGGCPGRDQYPQHGMDESCKKSKRVNTCCLDELVVTKNGTIELSAHEVWGALRGLETFAQIIYLNGSQFVIRCAAIWDWPEYSIRGVLIDTSRHFLRTNVIKRQIDLLALNKMNTLHWHIVDTQSFPFESQEFPDLHLNGSFSPRHTYTRSDVKEIVEHARKRGIRVLPEFDTPGHMGSWRGQNGLLTNCSALGRENSNILNPAREENYQFLKRFFSEVITVFPEKWLHLGGDEAAFDRNCWTADAEVKEFMKLKGFKSAVELEGYYNERLLDVIGNIRENGTGTKSRNIFWQESFDAAQPNATNSVYHLWFTLWHSREHLTKKYTALGYDVIVSSCWYLNYQCFNELSLAMSLDMYSHAYECKPREFDGTPEEKRRVIGGVATMWAEMADGGNLESNLWPRTSAVAERLWSNPEDTKNAKEAWPRLHEHRCRLAARGYRVAPVNGPGYCPFELEDTLWDT